MRIDLSLLKKQGIAIPTDSDEIILIPTFGSQLCIVSYRIAGYFQEAYIL